MSEMGRYSHRSMSFNKLNLKNSRGHYHDAVGTRNSITRRKENQPNSYISFQDQRIKEYSGLPQPSADNQNHYQQPRYQISSENQIEALRRRNEEQRFSQNRGLVARKRESETTVEPNREASIESARETGREYKAVYERDLFGNKYRIYGQSNFSYGSRAAFRKQNMCETCCSCILATCCCCCGGAMLYGAT